MIARGPSFGRNPISAVCNILISYTTANWCRKLWIWLKHKIYNILIFECWNPATLKLSQYFYQLYSNSICMRWCYYYSIDNVFYSVYQKSAVSKERPDSLLIYFVLYSIYSNIDLEYRSLSHFINVTFITVSSFSPSA